MRHRHPVPGPAAKASAAAVADHKHPGPGRPEQRAAEPAGLPLSPLPGTRTDLAPTAPGPAQDAPAAAADRQNAGTPRRTHKVPAPPRRATPRKPAAHPTVRAKTRPTAKAGVRTPAPRRPGYPVPGVRGGDMAALCRSAHGVTSPAITALCQHTYV
ncbi:hypothetical protein ACWGDE_34700 [Streptomyces sp. NPDC054956]